MKPRRVQLTIIALSGLPLKALRRKANLSLMAFDADGVPLGSYLNCDAELDIESISGVRSLADDDQRAVKRARTKKVKRRPSPQ